MYCKHCGNPIDDDSTFCANCGKSVAAAKGSKPGTASQPVNPQKPKRQKPSKPQSSSDKNTLYLVLTILCALPLIYAEYRRIVLGNFDIMYWLCAAPIILSVVFLYRIIGAPTVAEEKQKLKEAQDRGEHYDVPHGGITELFCHVLSVCLLILAIYAFAVSGAIQLFT